MIRTSKEHTITSYHTVRSGHDLSLNNIIPIAFCQDCILSLIEFCYRYDLDKNNRHIILNDCTTRFFI